MNYEESLTKAKGLGIVLNAREERAFKEGWNKEVDTKLINTDKTFEFTMSDALRVDQRCAKLFGASLSDLYLKNRKREVVDARNLAMFIMRYRYRTEMPNPYYREGNGEPEIKVRLYATTKIGRYFLKDHSSVLHSLKEVKNYIEWSKTYRSKVEHILFEFIPGYSNYNEFMEYLDSCEIFINSKC